MSDPLPLRGCPPLQGGQWLPLSQGFHCPPCKGGQPRSGRGSLIRDRNYETEHLVIPNGKLQNDMTRRCFSSALIVCVFAASLQGQKREALLEAVRATSGWRPTDDPTVYDQSNIERFASDLAPTLKRYGLKGVT